MSQIRLSQSYGDEFVFNIGVVFLGVDLANLFFGDLDFGPAVHFNSQMFLHNVCICVADGDYSTLFYDVQLFVEGHQLYTSVLVTDDALANSVERAAIVPFALADNRD